MCVYFKTNGESCVIINLYVDDMLILGTNLHWVDDTKRFLSSVFDMKDLGVIEVILGIKIIRDNDGTMISYFNYIEKILQHV